MSDKIKPSEVSEVLQQQLQEVNSSEKFDEVGTVLTVSDGVARIYGLRNAEANELLEFENGTMAIVMNLPVDEKRKRIESEPDGPCCEGSRTTSKTALSSSRERIELQMASANSGAAFARAS